MRYSPARLSEVSRFLKLEISKDKELQEIVELAADVCGASKAMISLIDGDTQFVRYHFGDTPKQANYKDTICQYTLEHNNLLVIYDTSLDVRLTNSPFVTGNSAVKFYAGIPLISQNGFGIGTLCVVDESKKVLTSLQQEMLKSLADQVTRLLEFDMTRQRLKEQYDESIVSATTLLAYFQSSSSCHLLIDKDRRAVVFNQALSDVFYANHQHYLKEGMGVTDFINPAFKNEFITFVNRALQGEHMSLDRQLEYKQGKIHWYMCFEPAYDTEGIQMGVSFNATDVTDSVNNQEMLSAQLDAIMKIKDLQTNELLVAIEAIAMQVQELAALPGLSAVHEFTLVQSAVEELLSKKHEILPNN